jgi:hypothetical protein
MFFFLGFKDGLPAFFAPRPALSDPLYISPV